MFLALSRAYALAHLPVRERERGRGRDRESGRERERERGSERKKERARKRG